MKRNLILSLAILTISLSGLAIPASAKSCDSGKQESSIETAGQKHKNKEKKEKKTGAEQQDNNYLLSIYG